MVQRHKVPFVLAATAHGPVILNALDWRPLSNTYVEFGAGLSLLVDGEHDLALVSLTMGALEARRRAFGPGAVALDCGANIGIFSMEWARSMEGWGSIIAFEPQERLFYALAGNLAINNLFNVKAWNKAVGAECGIAEIPTVDYCVPNHFGGISMKDGVGSGQSLPKVPVEVLTIDSLQLDRVDFIKLDIEGMEAEALEGARDTVMRSKPFMLCEWHITGKEPIEKFMRSVGFQTAYVGMNVFAGPPCDVMSRFQDLSKQTEEYNVRSSRETVRESADSNQAQGQQNFTGVAG